MRPWFFEIDCGAHFDLLSRSVVKLLLGWINSGCIAGVWLATPCTSWSRARHGPPQSGWCTFCSNQHIMGLPNLKPRDVDKIALGNRTMLVAARIIRLCISCHVPCFFENPSSSMIWLAGPIKYLCSRPSHILNLTDFCQHGARWRKRTRISAWNTSPAPKLNMICKGHHGICSRSNKHHIVLTGSDPISKQLWTHIAQPYPAAFATAAADALIDSAGFVRDRRLSSITC
jgi:hypothetical protein